MSDFLLSFEIDEDQTLKIHGDEKGLRNLCEMLDKLIKNTNDGCFNHDHLMTPQWAGYELSEANKGGAIINHVKVYCWKGEEFQK